MYNLIWADLFKLRKSLIIKVLFVLTTLSAAIMTLIAYLIPEGKIDASMTSIGFLFSDINVISILGAVVAGTFICGDFDNKLIHDAIANGCSRSAVIVSKAVGFFCGLVVILLPYILIVSISLGTGFKFSMGSVALGFLHLLTTNTDAAFSISHIARLLVVIFVLIIVYIAQLSICIPLAIAFKKPVFVVAVFYAFSIICGQLGTFKGRSAIFDNIFACTPYGGNYSFITLSTGATDMLKTVFVSITFTAVMLGISYFIFRKSEIK